MKNINTYARIEFNGSKTYMIIDTANQCLFATYSEDKCIQVCNLEESETIGVVTNLCAFIDTLDSTKEEFDLEFQRVSNVLNDLTT